MKVDWAPEGNSRDNTGEKRIGGYKSRLGARRAMPRKIQEEKMKGGNKSRSGAKGWMPETI